MSTQIKIHRPMAMTILFYLCGAGLIILLYSCSDGNPGPSSDPSADTGSAAFQINWYRNAVDTNADSATAEKTLDCAAEGVVTVSCEVYDADRNHLAKGGPWSCSDGQGKVTGILPGSERVFVTYGADADGHILYHGQSSKGTEILAGDVSIVGTIIAMPFVPILLRPDNSSKVSADTLTLSWLALSNARQYQVLVADEDTFSAPVIDEITSNSTYTPLNLPVDTQYYWKIIALDNYGNQGAESSIWHFTTNPTVTCQPPVFVPIGNKHVDVQAPLVFSVNATDPDTQLDQLVYSIDDLPSGADFDLVSREFKWTPGPDSSDNYPIQFKVCDDCTDGALCATEDIVISVGDVCRPPELTAIGPQQTSENVPITFSLSAEDPDTAADQLTFTLSELPAGAAFDRDSLAFNWTPSFDHAGKYPVTITVCDDCTDGQLCDSETMDITVTNVCRAPELDPVGDKPIITGETLEFTVNGKDPDDGDTLTYQIDPLPQGAEFDSNTGEFKWTPNINQEGAYPVTLTVLDSCSPQSKRDFEDILITVGPYQCKKPKLADPGNQTVRPGQTLSFGLSATDDDTEPNKLTYSAAGLPDNAIFDPTTRTFTWTPVPGDIGDHEITFMVCDDCRLNSLCDSLTVTITVESICHPDLPSPSLSYTGKEDHTGSDGNTYTRYSLSVNNRDQYPDDLFTAAPHLPPCGLNTNASRTWVRIYDQNQIRIYGFCALSSSASLDRLWFAVLKGNPPPSEVYIRLWDRQCDHTWTSNRVTIPAPCKEPTLIDPGRQSVDPGQELRFSLSATDEDTDPAQLRYSADDVPNNANFDSATRTFTWTPGPRDVGNHHITFTVCDDCQLNELCDTIIVTITVEPVCRPSLPAPILSYKGNEDYTGSNGNTYTRYRITVDNRNDYPNALFAAAPHLPPCGLNTNASRTWVDIYNQNQIRLYGFCAFSSPEHLDLLWFAVRKGNTPPSEVYIKLTDRQCNLSWTSNRVNIPAP